MAYQSGHDANGERHVLCRCKRRPFVCIRRSDISSLLAAVCAFRNERPIAHASVPRFQRLKPDILATRFVLRQESGNKLPISDVCCQDQASSSFLTRIVAAEPIDESLVSHRQAARRVRSGPGQSVRNCTANCLRGLSLSDRQGHPEKRTRSYSRSVGKRKTPNLELEFRRVVDGRNDHRSIPLLASKFDLRRQADELHRHASCSLAASPMIARRPYDQPRASS